MAPLAPIIAFLLGRLVLYGLLSDRGRSILLDEPNERSLHEKPVPRSGGFAILAGTLGAFAWLSAPGALTGGVVALAAVSMLDDWRSLSPVVRLAVHLSVCALFVAFALQGLSWPWLAAVAVGLGWMANLYNFMDGADGLAGGMAVMGFGALAGAAMLGGDAALAWLCASIAAAASAFLLSNFPPARIFMGDAGSVPLGYLAGAVGALGWSRGLWPAWFPVLAFGPFVLDATTTLLRRGLRGERVWQAHRSHYYQRAILLGWTHRQTVLFEYALMATCAGCGLLALGRSPFVQVVLVSLPLTVIAGVMIVVDIAWARRRSA